MNAIFRMVSQGRQGNLKSIIINRPDVQGTVCQELLQAARQVEGLLDMDIEFDEDSDLEDLEDSDIE